MSLTIISALMPALIKLIMYFLEKNEDKKEARESFLRFIEAWNKDESSKKLRDSYKRQKGL